MLSADAAREFWTEEGCHILELANDSGDPDVSVARARVEPGVRTRRHRVAGTAERYVILSGRGRVALGDQPGRDVRPGDVVRIPAGLPQCITNTGAEDLVFLCVCSPRFERRNFVDIEPAASA